MEAHKRKQPPKHTVPTMCDICGKVLKGISVLLSYLKDVISYVCFSISKLKSVLPLFAKKMSL